MRTRDLVVTTSSILLVWGCAFGEVIFVDGDNSSGIEDGSREHPFQLISSGLIGASPGDTVLVMPGLYSETLMVDMHDSGGMNRACVVMQSGVTLASHAGPDSTAIRGVGTAAAVYMDSCDGDTRLIGFRLEMSGVGWGLRRSIVLYSASPVIEGNTFASSYCGVYAQGESTPVIHDNLIMGGWLSFVSGSGGHVSGNEIEGGIGVSHGTRAAEPLLVELNSIYGSPEGYEDCGIRTHQGTPATVLVSRNVIEGKAVGAEVCYGAFEGNRFSDNDVNLRVSAACTPWMDIDAEANWWGTADPDGIDASIEDCYDDPGIAACVDFTPWCIVPDCTETVVDNQTWGLIKALYRGR